MGFYFSANNAGGGVCFSEDTDCGLSLSLRDVRSVCVMQKIHCGEAGEEGGGEDVARREVLAGGEHNNNNQPGESSFMNKKMACF